MFSRCDAMRPIIHWSMVKESQFYIFAAGQPRLVPSLEVLLLHGDTFFGRMPDEAEVEDRPRSRGPGLPQKPQQNNLRVPLPRRGQPQQPRHQMSDESCIQKR